MSGEYCDVCKRFIPIDVEHVCEGPPPKHADCPFEMRECNCTTRDGEGTDGSEGRDGAALLIDACYIGGDAPFICGAWGKISGSVMEAIEKDLSITEQEGALFTRGDGIYRLEARYEPGQYGEFGRCEFPPYWYCTEVAFTPLESAPAAPIPSTAPAKECATGCVRASGVALDRWICTECGEVPADKLLFMAIHDGAKGGCGMRVVRDAGVAPSIKCAVDGAAYLCQSCKPEGRCNG